MWVTMATSTFRSPAILKLPVPSTSLLSGSHDELVVVASSQTAGSDNQAVVWNRQVEAVDSARTDGFLPLPTGVATDASSFSYTPVDGASLHTLAVKDQSGITRWSVAVFDGSTEVALPTQVELPTGALRFVTQAIEVPGFDPHDFRLDDVKDQLARVSAHGVAFSN